MSFELTISSGENTTHTVDDPTPERIDQAINDLIPAAFHFAILESNPPTDNCWYIQTFIVPNLKPEIKYMVESRFVYDDYYKHYRSYTTDTDMLKRMFRMFALGIIPDVIQWADITERSIQLYEELKQGKRDYIPVEFDEPIVGD